MDYLVHALRYLDTIDSDPVTKDVVARWQYTLEKLAEDPQQLNREVDWVIKRELIETYMARNRLSWRDPKSR